MVDRQEVLDALKDRKVLERVFAELDVELFEEGDHYKTWCPWHDDTPGRDGEGRPNLSVDSGHTDPTTKREVDPGTFRCFSCGSDVAGSIFDYVAGFEKGGEFERAKGGAFREALERVAKLAGLDGSKPKAAKKKTTRKKPIKEVKQYTSEELEALVDQWTQNLHGGAHADALAYLRESRGLSKRVIREQRLGYEDDQGGGRVTIPVFDEKGRVALVRKHRPSPLRQGKEPKVINFPKGTARNNPRMNVRSGGAEYVHLFAGEMDYLVARSLGWDGADSFISGESYRPSPEQVVDWVGKAVVIWADHDKPDPKTGLRVGWTMANKLAGTLASYGCEPFLVSLEGHVEEGQDFSDLVVNHKYTRDRLNELIADAVEWAPPDNLPKPDTDEEPLTVHLADAGTADYHNKRTRLRVKAFVTGKDMHSYLAPKTVHYKCPTGTGRDGACAGCPLAEHGGETKLTLGPRNVELALMVAGNDAQTSRALRAVLNKPIECVKMRHEVLDKQDLELVRITPVLDDGYRETYDEAMFEREAVQHVAYVVKKGIATNQNYAFTGYVGELADKGVTYTFGDAEPLDDMASPFTLGGEEHAALARAFWPAPEQSVAEKMEAIADDLAANVTRIYGRPTLHIALDLVWHSLGRGFTFRGEFVDRSYVQALVVGDTRQGKTQVGERLRKHYRAGRYLSSENLRYTGLIGALERAGGGGDNWRIKWGIYPQCNGGALFLDEIQDIAGEALADLSTARSSGVASIQKVVAARAPARVRLICGANPRDSEQALDTYTYGVLSFEGVIRTREDIARFDFGLTVASGDVDPNLLNAEELPTHEHTITAELSHLLLRWVWSRPSNAVEFSDGADRLVLSRARDMAERYSPAIPLVDAAEQRIKLARLSVAVAARLFSTDDGSRVIVTPEHVEYAFDYLNRIYSSPSMAYDAYSATKREEKGLTEEQCVEIRQALAFVKPGPEWAMFPATMERIEPIFTTRTLSENLGIDGDVTRQLIERLSYYRLAKSVLTPPNSFRKTARLVAWLRWVQTQAPPEGETPAPTEKTKKIKRPVRMV